jgi:PDZ domain-containing secreted protein
MLKKTIEYVDYNGVKRTEDFYFNLSEAELLEMHMSTDGGMDAFINRIIQTQDNRALTQMFKDLLFKSYGVKSLDGKRFMKSEELSTEFSQTEAYSKLYVELATDAEKAAEFVNGIIPGDKKVNASEILAEFK